MVSRRKAPNREKKAPRCFSGALLRVAQRQSPVRSAIRTDSSHGELGPLVNYDKVRIARANHAFRVDKAVHVNRNPAGIHEDEVGVPDQPEMVLPKSLDEELLRMPSKTEHFCVARPELLLVHGR
jgi:hypothetical protein